MAKFEYKNVPLQKIQVELQEGEEVKKARSGKTAAIHGGKLVKAVVIDGEPIAPTDRFWNSLYARFGLNTAFFKYFSHEQVFDRIVEREAESSVRLTIERNETGDSRLLAATGLNRPVIVYDDLMEILENCGLEQGKISYADGIVTSTHDPRVGGGDQTISGDSFRNKFVLHSPIDGFGNPNIYLSLLRLICSNGMVGYAKAFQSSLALGSGSDNIRYTLMRAIDGFQNEEGYAMIRDRFELAANSWASLREHQSLYSLLLMAQNDEKLGKARATEMRHKFEDMAGRPLEMFHREPNMFTDKRLRTLPVECKVYDMINFATEVATHHVSEATSRKLHAWVGQLLSTDYDLEGSCDSFDDWRDFFMKDNRDKFAEDKKRSKELAESADAELDDDDE